LGKNFGATERFVQENRKRDDLDDFIEGAMTVLGISSAVSKHIQTEDMIAKFDKSLDQVMHFGDKFVAETAEKADFEKGKSYFERLVARKELSYKDISNVVAMLLMAGVDTTSGLTLWNLLNIGRFPKVQEKLYEEIKSVVGDGPVLDKHLEKLEYMKQVMRESHRFTPAGPAMTHRTLDHPIILSGFEIPPGTRINLAPAPIQMDPRFVDNPEEFIPERWSKEAVAKRKGTPQEIVDSLPTSKPFGMGPRMCLGARLAEAEVKVFLCHLLRDWKFEWDPNEQKYKVDTLTLTQAVPYPRMTMKPRRK